MNNLEALAKELEEHVKRTEELQKKFEEASKKEETFKFPHDGYFFDQLDKKVEYSTSSIYNDPELYATASLAEYYGKIIRKNMIIAQYVSQKAPDYRFDEIEVGKAFWYISKDNIGTYFADYYRRKMYTIPTVVYMPQSVAKQLVEDLNSGKINLEEL